MMAAVRRILGSKFAKQTTSAMGEADLAAQLWAVKQALARTTEDLERAWKQDQWESARVIMLREEYAHLVKRLNQLDTKRKVYIV